MGIDLDDAINGEGNHAAVVPLDPSVTREVYLQWRAPRCGAANPERMNNPLWEWLVRSRVSAYQICEHMGEPDACRVGPGWCFQRFGQSKTQLPDGRTVYIGGEHEDYYDTDFYIYNDVVVRHPDQTLDIFGYPRSVFPPTDFHSATLSGNKIIIIGRLGYPGERSAGTTPVFQLDSTTFAVVPFPTTGEGPGWISKHSAEMSVDQSSIIVRGGRNNTGPSVDDWSLDLVNGVWQRLTDRQWQVWQVQRADAGFLHLFQIRSELFMRQLGQTAFSDTMRKLKDQFDTATLEEELGGPIDEEAFRSLFAPPLKHEPGKALQEFPVHTIVVNGVDISYEESVSEIEVTIKEGLPQSIIETVIEDLRLKLERLERTGFVAKRL